MVRLGVNIDHVATLRQARGEAYPSLVEAARVCLRAGADLLTIHLREDRRHIQDTDVEAIRLVTQEFGKPLNLEMGCAQDIVKVAIASNPDWICLVPEKREERTTEGGLNLIDEQNFRHIQATCLQLKSALKNVKISLFLEARPEILHRAVTLPVDAVEIHTGQFAHNFINEEDIESSLIQFKQAAEILSHTSIALHAGHGLTAESLLPLLQTGLFREYNIGHWIICQALFNGLEKVVWDLKGMMNANS